MKFVLVNGRSPRSQSRCSLCCEPIGEGYLRDVTTQLSYCGHACYRGHCNLGFELLKERAIQYAK